MLVADRPTTARRAVITDIARMEIADITALLDARLLAERANRRVQIAAELVALDAAHARDADEIADINQTASDRPTQEAASQRATDAMRARRQRMDTLQAEDRELAAGRITFDLAGIHLLYDLAHYINATDPNDTEYTADARDARLSTNPFVVALADGRVNRADLIRSVCQAAGVRIPAQYAAYGTASATPTSGATLPRLHQATNRAASNIHPLLGRWLASAPVMFTICAVCLLSVAGLVWLTLTPAAPAPQRQATPSVSPGTAAAPAFPTENQSSARASVPLQLARALVVPAVVNTTPTGSTPLPTTAPQPHGPYTAPSQLAIPAFQLTLPVNRVRTHDTEQPDGTLQVVLDSPQIGEVTHYGAYPGEVGTLWLFSTNATLGRRPAVAGERPACADRQNGRGLHLSDRPLFADRPSRAGDRTSAAMDGCSTSRTKPPLSLSCRCRAAASRPPPARRRQSWTTPPALCVWPTAPYWNATYPRPKHRKARLFSFLIRSTRPIPTLSPRRQPQRPRPQRPAYQRPQRPQHPAAVAAATPTPALPALPGLPNTGDGGRRGQTIQPDTVAASVSFTHSASRVCGTAHSKEFPLCTLSSPCLARLPPPTPPRRL